MSAIELIRPADEEPAGQQRWYRYARQEAVIGFVEETEPVYSSRPFRRPGSRQALTLDVEAPGPFRAWLRAVLDHMAHLLELEPGWDGYAAPIVHQDAVVHALNALGALVREDSDVPSIVPTCAGGIQFEWVDDGIELELEVYPSGEIDAYYRHPSGEEWEGSLVDLYREAVPSAGVRSWLRMIRDAGAER